MGHQPNEIRQSPRYSASAFAKFSNDPISPHVSHLESPSTFARKSSSFARNASVGSQQQQEESYFADLLSYSLERLGKEPELLSVEREQLQQQTQEAAVSHYQGLLKVASCLGELRQEVAAIDHNVEDLQHGLPVVTQACQDLAAYSKENVAKRAQNKQLLKQQSSLLEILEVPALMESCVRNGNYEDALDLRAFISKTALLHPELKVVQLLVRQSEEISQDMLPSLVGRLQSNIQLPECLRVVAHLRRLAAFSEPQLRDLFLRCREEWLLELVEALDESNAYDYLKRLTDAHRLQLFDAVMQFRAIFADDYGQEEIPQPEQGGGAVYGWAEHRVVFYLETLAKQLPRMREGGALASVLEHCMYCGLSLGRVGLDFRGLLPPIFEACIFNLFSKSVQAAVETSLMVLDMHKWVALPSLAARRGKTAATATEATPSRPNAVRGFEDGPPYSLMEHPPLAMLTNGLLGALNELRHCAPLSLAPRLGAVLQDALTAVVQALSHYKATRTLNEEETALLLSACTAMKETLCPYIVGCFAQIFPSIGESFLSLQKVTSALSPAETPSNPAMPENFES